MKTNSNSTARKLCIYFTLAITILFLSQCVEEDSTTPSGLGWTGADPTSIPLRQRMLQAERGNLVKNPSFEQGRIINVDSNTVSHNIIGWKEMGENVNWIRTEIRSGSYSIKIKRSPGSEALNQEDGIVSDFIRVIPGNYKFSFWIKLKDIKPRQVRRGRRRDGSIDVRILFYDKNRLLISGNTYDHSEHAIIDRSCKSLPFNDFWKIDSLDWTSVNGRTTHDYLTEGDIPDEAKFVKVYLGLKGTGTMWIDDVDFRYTRNNFTSMESTKRLLDTTFSKLDMVIPTPHEACLLDPVLYHFEGRDSIPMPIIKIPPRPFKQTRKAAELLQAKLDAIFAERFGKDSLPGIRISSNHLEREVESGALVFAIGIRRLPDTGQNLGSQGYTIQPDTLYPNLVYLSGVTETGDYYAAATAVQLLDDSLFIYHQSAITDYPDIPQRAFLVSPVAAASNSIDYSPYLSEMAELKLNWAYLDYCRDRSLWKQESPAYRDGLKIIGAEGKATGMLTFAQMIHPYAFLLKDPILDSLDMDVRERWAFAQYSSRVKFIKFCTTGLEAGVTTLVFCFHDHLPRTSEGIFVLPALRDQNEYINLQAAHADILQTLDYWRNRRNKKIDFEFISPWYSNEDLVLSRGQAEQYFNDLSPKMPDDLRILWSGPSRYSPDINSVDYYRFQHNLAGREMILMDNSMNKLQEIIQDTAVLKHHPMKLRTLNIFDPYSVRFTEPFTLPGEGGKMLINSSLSSEVMKIRMATAADYMWNSAAYDPDLSVWKVLVSRYGKTAALELYRFSDAYFISMASMIGLKRSSDHQRLMKTIREQQKIMEESLMELDHLLYSEQKLLNELKILKKSLEAIYKTKVKAVSVQIIAAVESM